MYGLYLIGVLIVVGGVIATIGDRIGHVVGRRKLSLFGLRPKHTSFVITVMTGLTIVAASLATMSWLSHDVRTALFHMQEIREAYNENLQAYEESKQQLAALRAQVADSEQYLSGIVAARDRAANETRQLELQNASLQEQLAESQEELDRWKAHVVYLQMLGEELQSNVGQLEMTKEELVQRIQHLTDEMQHREVRLRQERFIFLRDDIVYGETVEAGRMTDDITDDVLDIAAESGALATQAGAKTLEIDEESMDDAVRFLTEQTGSWQVHVVAKQNTLPGETLPVTLQVVVDEA